MHDLPISKILAQYETDKVNGHTYGESYDDIFSNFDRNAPLDIIEIGTQKGGSLKAWRDYFPNATVTGIDIIDVVKPEYRDPSINYVVSDVKDYKPDREFDIVIDDGSHFLEDVLYTVDTFKLKKGGVMVIEDTQDPNEWSRAVRDATDYEMKTRDLRGAYDNFLIALWNY